jgi:hypothetical protein
LKGAKDEERTKANNKVWMMWKKFHSLCPLQACVDKNCDTIFFFCAKINVPLALSCDINGKLFNPNNNWNLENFKHVHKHLKKGGYYSFVPKLISEWTYCEFTQTQHGPKSHMNYSSCSIFLVLMRTISQTSQGQNSQDSQNWNTLATYDVGGPSLSRNLINQIEHASTPSSCYLLILSKAFHFQVKFISNQWFYLPFQYMVEFFLTIWLFKWA